MNGNVNVPEELGPLVLETINRYQAILTLPGLTADKLQAETRKLEPWLRALSAKIPLDAATSGDPDAQAAFMLAQLLVMPLAQPGLLTRDDVQLRLATVNQIKTQYPDLGKKKSMLPIIGIVAVGAIGLGVGAWFLLKKK